MPTADVIQNAIEKRIVMLLWSWDYISIDIRHSIVDSYIYVMVVQVPLHLNVI